MWPSVRSTPSPGGPGAPRPARPARPGARNASPSTRCTAWPRGPPWSSPAPVLLSRPCSHRGGPTRPFGKRSGHNHRPCCRSPQALAPVAAPTGRRSRRRHYRRHYRPLPRRARPNRPATCPSAGDGYRGSAVPNLLRPACKRAGAPRRPVANLLRSSPALAPWSLCGG